MAERVFCDVCNGTGCFCLDRSCPCECTRCLMCGTVKYEGMSVPRWKLTDRSPSEVFSPSEERKAELAAMPYNEYLQSPEWKERRRVLLNERENTCRGCGRRNARLQIHHLTYERRGDERDEDLEAFCRKCHERAHGITT